MLHSDAASDRSQHCLDSLHGMFASPYLFYCKMMFSSPKQAKNLDLTSQTVLNYWECFEREKTTFSKNMNDLQY